MSKITEQARVIVIKNNEIRRGTVGTLFEGLGVAIVNFDDGNVEKVRLSELGIEPVAEPTEEAQEANKDRVEGCKVITKKEFMDAVNFVTTPEEMLGDKVGEVDPMSVMIKGMSVMIVGMNISEKLFKDKEEIEITKEQLSEVIKENTCPTEISKSIDGKMSVSDVFPIAILSALVLLKLVKILFGDSEND